MMVDRFTGKQKNVASWIGLFVWSSATLLFCYGSSLSMPFMADDFFQFPFVTNHTLSEIWQTADGLYYFRPVAFSYWKIAESIFGYHHAWFLHASNLVAHLVNALLVAWLADRLWVADSDWSNSNEDWVRRFIATSLFITSPFSYEAIPWISALMHPLMVTLVLFSIIGYLKLRNCASRVWGVFSLSCAFLAPFAHENGALVLPLLVAVEITRADDRAQQFKKRVALLSLWILPLLLWYLLWRLEPRAVGTGGLEIDKFTCDFT